jgi:PKD repeat protein
MKKPTNLLLILGIAGLFLFSSHVNAQLNIAGPSPVCNGDTASYGFPLVSPPEVSYHWSVTGGYVNYSNLNKVNITWTGSGSGVVHLTLINKQTGGVHLTANKTVTIHPKPIPIIIDTNGSSGSNSLEFHTVFCADETESGHEPEDNDCHAVCAAVHLGYKTALHAGSTYQWSSIGHGGGNGTLTNHYITILWPPIPPYTGQVTVTETDINGCVGHAELCIKKRVGPAADFYATAQYDSSNQNYYACKDQEIYFFNTSTGNFLTTSFANELSWHWDFGDGSISTDENPSHTFTNPGNYDVTLTVVDECGCYDPIDYNFEIKEEVPLTIRCASTVCEGEIARYTAGYADPDYKEVCTDFVWTVVDGQITSGQGTDEILVKWSGPTHGYGTVTLDALNCDPEICSFPTTVKIPIITKVDMEGDSTPCTNTQTFYSIPAQPGVRFLWTVSGGTIVGGTTTRGPEANLSKIAVNWGSTGGSHSVSVSYANQPLQCNSSSSMNITLLDSFYVSGPTAACVGPNYSYQATAGGSYSWKVLDENGVVSSGPIGSGSSLSFPSSGIYYVEATKTSGVFCNEIYRHKVEVVAAPPQPDTVYGDFVICPENYYEYQAASSGADFVIKWIFTGANIDTAFGEQATISWLTAAPTYSIKVVHLAIAAPHCSSDTFTVGVVKKPNPIPVIIGDDSACVSSLTDYQTNKVADEYRWSVLPVTSGSVGSQFTSSIEMEWHDNPGVITLRLEAKVCNEIAAGTKSVTLLAQPIPILSTTTGFHCKGRTAHFDLNVDTNATDFTWNFGDGSGDFTDTLPNSKEHVYSKPGNYTVSVKVWYDGQYCEGPYTATLPITVSPAPDVRLSAEIDPIICPPDTVPHGTSRGGGGMWLNATVYGTSSIGNYNVDWFTVNPTTGSITSTIALNGNEYDEVSAYDSYRIRVTDKTTSCLGWSNIITVDTCNPQTQGQGPPTYPKCTDSIPTGIDFTFVLDTSQCGKVIFTPVLAANRVFYFFELDSGQASTGFTHVYAKSGIYHVKMHVLQINGGDTCRTFIVKPVTVPFVGKMSYNFICNTPNIIVDLKSNHNFVHQLNLDKPNYFRFDLDPAVGSNPKGLGQTILPPGSYQVEMVSRNTISGSMCKIQDSIIVPQVGVADFTVSSGPYCQKSPVAFTNASTGVIVKNKWDFDDFSESSLGSPSREYALFSSLNGEFTNRTARLTTTDHLGCVDTVTSVVKVNDHRFYDNPLFNINPILAAPFCDGDSVQLGIHPITGVVYSTYLWSIGATTSTIYSKSTASFWADVRDNKGCRNLTDLASTGMLPSPGARIIGERLYCPGEEIKLNAWRGDSYTYTWYKGLSPSLQISTEPLLKDRINLDGTYTYIIKIDDGTCVDYDTTQVEVLKAPVVSISSSNGRCAADAPTLTANAVGTSPFLYKWNTGLQDQQVTVLNGGMYAVQVTDAAGCREEAHVDIIPMADFQNIMTGCYKFCEDDLDIVIQGMGSGYTDNWIDEDAISHGGSPFTITSSSATANTLVLETTHTSSQCKDISKTFSYQIIPSELCEELIPRLKPATGNAEQMPEPADVDFQVDIAPNPADQSVSISYDFAGQEDNRIVIVDAYQRKVQEFNNLNSKGNEQLTTAALPSGWYLVLVISKDVMQVQKLIINH